MNADSTYQIGKDHLVCEDYALSGVSAGRAYAIVCDGCSASTDVDFGARAMALSAKRTLLLDETLLSEKLFGEVTIRNAQRVFDVFPLLHPQALDTTLLVVNVQDGKATTYIYGDGIYIHRHKNGVWVNHIELSGGAPDYLSYHLDYGRMASYNAMPIEDRQKEIWYKRDDGTYDMTLRKPFDPVVMKISVEEGDVIAVMSDGINSFHRSDNTPIDWKELIDDFTNFGPATAGVFATRRIKNHLMKKCVKEGWTYRDDISIAAIVV